MGGWPMPDLRLKTCTSAKKVKLKEQKKSLFWKLSVYSLENLL